MQISEQDCGATQTAPRSGASAVAAPLLDNNPPNRKPEASASRTWTEQQCKIRRVCVDRLRYWQSHGFEVLWITLTSGVPASDLPEVRREGYSYKLREDFQKLRRRAALQWGVGIEYVCIETAEGNGVLHMLWGTKAQKGVFYIPYSWLSAEWARIHGAWSVWVARVREGKSSIRRLSRYVVSQYCGGQDALVRMSQSRMGPTLRGDA